jgi:5-methyltetrahydropteroyltriglutamate--homocysteine methyltransferase
VSNRINTTHVGSLPRPRQLLELMRRRAQGENVVEEALQTLLRESVRDVPKAGGACCIGPVAPNASRGLHDDLTTLRAAVDFVQPVGAFMNAASPGVVAVFQKNEFYSSEDAYIEAVAEALRPEYEAIVAAGFAPAEQMRMHICWGNYAGPHHFDIPLPRIASEVLGAKPRILLLEAANPRHAHEWSVFEAPRIPDEKILCSGVIESTSNYIEHPELVAQRLIQYARVVGRERVMAGSDCGFSTFSGFPTVYPDIVWKKMEAMVEGARLASKALWR